MNPIKYFRNHILLKCHDVLVKNYKISILFALLIFININVNAQDGLFIKFSLGPGITTEYSKINSSGFAIATKNHAIGWGFSDDFAIQIGEFGSLNKQSVGDYKYINLDAFGIGFSYKFENELKISMLGAYTKVSFAHNWWEAGGDDGGSGFGMNISLDKEWFISKRWGLRVGPQIFWLKTNDTGYKFFNASLNGSIVFYLNPLY